MSHTVSQCNRFSSYSGAQSYIIYDLPPSSPPSPPSGSLPPLLSSPLLPLSLTISPPPSTSSLPDTSWNRRTTGCCLMGWLGVVGLAELRLVLGKLGLAELLGLSPWTNALGRLLSPLLEAPENNGGGLRCCGGVKGTRGSPLEAEGGEMTAASTARP